MDCERKLNPMIETRLLHYFLVVAREQNITNAAKALHITQPTLRRTGCQPVCERKQTSDVDK